MSRGSALFAVLALGMTTAAHAGGNADAAKGLVADQCAKCHETPYTKPGATTPAVQPPAFQAMADDPQQYPRERLRAFLRQPHFPMQQFALSKRDIDNVLAYIESLRD